ncbi:S41 family peptidase [Natronogracilivirga saccharolytica]|nr:S41 family peptidase [Natronogracilivirga saccharolytica]
MNRKQDNLSMTFKQFVTPPLVSAIILTLLYLSGVDRVAAIDKDHETNLRKYTEVQRKIIENHVEETSIDELFKNSMKGFVRNIADTTMDISGTPLDTTFTDVEIGSIRESFSKFENAYMYLMNNSGEDEDMVALVEHSIREMFRPLDPHSVYIKPETSESIQEEFSGKFEGIGIQFQVIDDTITVISAISNGPSDQLGIQSGDRIVKIDGDSAIGFSEQDVVSSLRGPKGSKVTVGIQRPGNNQLLDFEITRDEIPLYTLDSSYMLDDETGYIRINRFAATTHEEFTEAMKDLRNQDMERLILDLRGNPGGYLEQAVRMTNDFFPRGTKLVATESRHARFTSEYRARYDGPYRDIPLIVLVNEGSASGSEIVSGAVQDHDRGLVVGRRTFGKGLVQQQYELADKSNIRITISRYLTPSGREIQKPFKDGREKYLYEIYSRDDSASGDVDQFVENVPDSLRYKTASGREVYGGGGVVPDHIVDVDRSNELFVLMRRNNVGSTFVRNYIDRQGDQFRSDWKDRFGEFRSDFKWSENQRDDFVRQLSDNGLVLADTVTTAHFDDNKLYLNDSLLEEQLEIPLGWMKADLARQVWGNEYFYPVINDEVDMTVNIALTLWPEVQKLQVMRDESESSGDMLDNIIPRRN